MLAGDDIKNPSCDKGCVETEPWMEEKGIIISKETGSIVVDGFRQPDDGAFEAFTHYEIAMALDFALEIANNLEKPRHKHEHGKRIRGEGEFVINLFIGKLGEICTYNNLCAQGTPCSKPDFTVYEGYDDCDLKIYEQYMISVKASKANSRLLLLENSKYDDMGMYLHGTSNKDGTLRIAAFVSVAIRLNQYFIPKNIDKKGYADFLRGLHPSGYTYGFLSPKSIIEDKAHNRFYKAGLMLNRFVPLEVDNLAFRLDRMRPLIELNQRRPAVVGALQSG